MPLAPRFYFLMAVDASAIPQQDDGPAHMLEQVLQETLDIGPLETSPSELEIEGDALPFR